MSDEEKDRAVIEYVNEKEVLVNGKKRAYVDGKLEVTQDDILNPYTVGFTRLHKKLGMILASVKETENISLQRLLEFLADSTLIRMVHFEQGLGIPRFIARQIFRELVDARACAMTNGALRKTQIYYDIVKDMKTKASLAKKKATFVLPPEFQTDLPTSEVPLSERPIEELFRLREEAERQGTQEQLGVLDRHIKIKRQERKEEREAKIAVIMQERKVSHSAAEAMLFAQEDDEEARAHDSTEDFKNSEWYSDQTNSEEEDEDEAPKPKAKKKGKKKK